VTPYPKVSLGAHCRREQRVGGFLNAIVDEAVGTRHAFDQFLKSQ